MAKKSNFFYLIIINIKNEEIMFSNILKIILLNIFLCLIGCASITGFPERSDNVEEQLLDLQKKYFHPGASTPNGIITKYNSTSNINDRKKIRNEIVFNRLLAYDLQFSIFQEGVYKEGVVSNISLDILGVGIGAAGGVVSNLTASQILSALSGGIAGTKTAINKNLYFERTLPALFALMIANREKIRTDILRGLEQDDSTYSLGQAMSDLEKYYIAGSIPGAIASINEEAGKIKSEATIEFKEIRDKSFVNISFQKRIDKLLSSVDELSSGKSLEILTNPPFKFDKTINILITSSRGSTKLDEVKDNQAKSILKRVIVLTKRSEEELSLLESAILAE